jgi:hypothetical protein
MPLLDLWESNPQTISNFNLQQIVSAAGDGDLKDGSECSHELREYLTKASVKRLSNYIEQCLGQAFNKGGFVLQDLVNELGRRLEYTVENGRYSGTAAHIGFDGLWSLDGQASVIVEVKTTDAYRISLDTLATYRSKLVSVGKCDRDASILIVVGRQDTGELEAQIRGSRHAWDVRLISAEALLRLVEVKESAGQEDTDEKIRGLLRPTEYTRLDALVDVVFSATKDVETLADVGGFASGKEASPAVESSGPYQFTSTEDLSVKRSKVIKAYQARVQSSLVPKSRSLFRSADDVIHAVCTISKRYTKLPGRPYWYAYHPAWREFLNQAQTGDLILGMMDINRAFAIPAIALEPQLGKLNTTYKPDDKTYWHLHILEDAKNSLSLYVPGYTPMSLDQFEFRIDE